MHIKFAGLSSFYFKNKMKKTNALRLLESQQIDYEILEYNYEPENLDLGKIAADNQLDLKIIYKTLVLKGDKSGIIVAVLDGESNVSLKKLAEISGNKKTELVPVKDLQSLTGYIRGGCSPVGMKKKYPVFIDDKAAQLEKIYVNAGARGILFGIKPDELCKICEAIFVNIC